jgi:hypothetical protein
MRRRARQRGCGQQHAGRRWSFHGGNFPFVCAVCAQAPAQVQAPKWGIPPAIVRAGG